MALPPNPITMILDTCMTPEEMVAVLEACGCLRSEALEDRQALLELIRQTIREYGEWTSQFGPLPRSTVEEPPPPPPPSTGKTPVAPTPMPAGSYGAVPPGANLDDRIGGALGHSPYLSERGRELYHSDPRAALEELSGRSTSKGELVLRFEDAILAVTLLGRWSQAPTWEGRLRYPDGRESHSSRHREPARVEQSPGDVGVDYMLRTVALARRTMMEAQAAHEQAPESPGADLYFCITPVAA